MDSTFYFDGTTTYNSEIEVEDIQSCCLEAIDNFGYSSYIIFTTDLGITKSIEAGPFIPDTTDLPSNCSVVISEYDASEYSTKKQIKKFLGPKDKGKRKAIEVKVIQKEEALEIIRNAMIANLIV